MKSGSKEDLPFAQAPPSSSVMEKATQERELPQAPACLLPTLHMIYNLVDSSLF